ncbi:MAG: sialidase family protein, partial [bacterium]|nr:sialidase family protein [bacterium]
MTRLFILLTVLILISVPGLAFWSGTVQDQIISQDDNLLGWYTRSVVDFQGTIHTVWNERVVNYPTQQEIHYSRSTDNGRNWSAINQDVIVSFNDGINAENGSSIATDSQGDLYVVWSETDTGIDEIHYSISQDGGNIWSGQTADHVLSYPGASNAMNPWMVIDGDDVIHVVWNQTYPQSGTAEIYYARSLDGGASWSSQTAERIVSFPDGGGSLEPRIAVGNNDELYVIWREPDDSVATRGNINVSISTDGGNTWSGTTADHPVTASFRIILYPDLNVDANGIVHVVWKGTQDTASPYHYEIYHSRSIDGGVSWSGWTQEQRVSYYPPGDPSSNIPNIGADHSGNVIVVWDEEYDFGRNEIMVSASTDGGQTWSGSTLDEIISFPDAYPGYRPYVAAGLDDTLHVFWNEGTTSTGYYQIHYSRGDALGTTATVSINTRAVNPPVIIPANGGSFQYNISIHNLTTTPQTCAVWNKVRNSGNVYTQVWGPVTRSLPGGANPSRVLTQTIAGSISSGTLYFISYVGSYPNMVVDSSFFTITKSTVADGNPWIGESYVTGDVFDEFATTDVGATHASPLQSENFVLLGAYPNPFNPTTTIR